MMNGRHLPAGQGMPPDMGRRRPYNQHQQQHQHQQYPPQMYNNYMQPYGANYYPQQMPPQYHNAPMPQQYGPYPPYMRSPPPPQHMQQFAPAPLPQQQPYSGAQASPAIAASYQPPPPAQASYSTHSSHTIPAQVTPPTVSSTLSTRKPTPPPPPPPAQEEEEIRAPFRAPVGTSVASPVPFTSSKSRIQLPWLSRSDLPWPARRARRKRKVAAPLPAEPVEFPANHQSTPAEKETEVEDKVEEATSTKEVPARLETEVARPETPSTNQPASEEATSTNPTTPSSSQQQTLPAAGDITPVPHKITHKSPTPVVPVIPVLPKALSREAAKSTPEIAVANVAPAPPVAPSSEETSTSATESVPEKTPAEEAKEVAPAPKAWTVPKVWTGVFNPNAPTSTAASSEVGQTGANNIGPPNAETLAEALKNFNASSNESKVAFLEPRGLVNTGNMCYMNSVLQVLVFCTPFYNFLDQVSKRSAFSFKSETPLIDAMIMCMREYRIIDSAPSVEKLRLRLKDGELEQYGEAFTPDFVYNVINHLPRFSSMRRGHQQDAEEFLGFLLEGLHDECVQVMHKSASTATSAFATPTNGSSSPVSEFGSVQGSVTSKDNGWLEVGPKQKSAITRSSGTITTGSPVTKIFGGNLRSELRVPGMKDSVTLEPYQPLQLDIGAHDVNNIVDALKGLTRSETLHGDFKSPKGPNVTAHKQVFIESMPPVLILHLKRFQYDNAGGTQKIWKKVGYPLELEIPKEVFPKQKRAVYAHSGLPKYRLIAVVYHHGNNASGGHYTVDVRRQDGREWVRLDDTVIRRVRSEDVAEAGSEEDPKILAAALEAHKKDTTNGNGFAAIENAEEAEAEGDGWKRASGSGKKWSSVANGTATPKAKTDKFSVKDNKVAYLLFYQKI